MVVRRVGDGAPIVWLHGLGEQSASFDPIAASLAGFEHVLVDLPGYGRSTWLEPQSLEQTADLLADFLRLSGAIVVGHSMGGVLATLVGERTGLLGVVNIEGNLSRGDCSFSAQALPFTAEAFAATGFAGMRARIYEAGMTNPPLRGYHAAMTLASPAQFHRHASELVQLSETETLAPRFAALPCPTLYLAGVPRGICERSLGLLHDHGVRHVRVEPAGHWPFLNRASQVAELVEAFVRDACL